jgi:hypothetical protein
VLAAETRGVQEFCFVFFSYIFYFIIIHKFYKINAQNLRKENIIATNKAQNFILWVLY